jgi:hypothetical protein
MTNDGKAGRTEAVMAMARTQVSFRSRMLHLGLLLLASGMCVTLASLLATEEGLPTRTLTALAGLLAINLAWAAYAAWVLTARRTLLFNHRVIAAWIALAAATAFTAGAAALGMASGATAASLAAGLGLALIALSATLLIRARRDLQALQRRRAQLEARLAEVEE